MPQKKVTEKICITCKNKKPIEDFYIKERRKTATRYFSRCKVCYYKWVYAKDKKQGFRWHGDGELHHMARRIVRNALLSGRLIKPRACTRCDKIQKRIIDLHAHHEDYSKPLEVIWLCRACHKVIDLNRITK
jgi:hypothetical protein